MTIQDQIMARRTAAGLRLVFIIPDRDEPFVCYPATEASKTEWLAKAERKGWKRTQ